MKITINDIYAAAAGLAVGYFAFGNKESKVGSIGAIEQRWPNYHVLEVTYVGATDTKPSKVKITSHRFKQSVFMPFDYEYNSIAEMSAAYLQSKGFDVIGKGESKNGYYIITNTFEPLK